MVLINTRLTIFLSKENLKKKENLCDFAERVLRKPYNLILLDLYFCKLVRLSLKQVSGRESERFASSSFV